MIAILTFSAFAALLVFLAGRSDQARDPRFTVLVLVLLVIFPLSAFLPKTGVLPVMSIAGENSGFPWRHLLVGLWALGFLVAAARLALAAREISRWRLRSTRVGMSENVEIRELEGLKCPVAVGVFRRVVFVPGDWRDQPAESRRMILEHELSHHRRRDPLWRWIAEIACVVHGCNPLVIWISRRLTMQCEYACDAMVLRKGARAGDYARLLCDVAQDWTPPRPALAMAATSSLESRVRRLMKPQADSGSASLAVLITLSLACAGALATFGPSMRPEPEISADELELRWSANPFPGEE